MAITRRGNTITSAYSATSQLTATWSLMPNRFNVLIAVVSTYDTSGQPSVVTSIQQTGVGWAQQNQNMSGGYNVEIWLGTVNSTQSASQQTTINVSKAPSGGLRAVLMEYSGVGIQREQHNTNSGTGSITSTGSITTQATNQLIVGGVFLSGQSQTSAQNGFQLYDGSKDSSGNSLAGLDYIVTTTGTYSSGTTGSGSGSWYGCIASFPAGNPTLTTSASDNFQIPNILTFKAFQGNFIDLYTSQGMSTTDRPILNVSGSLATENDVIVYGSITTETDPNKTAGGGALIIGKGWTADGSPTVWSPSLIEMLNSDIAIPSGSSFPTSMVKNQPSMVFNRTDVGQLYIYTGSSWNSVGPTSGYFDTLFLLKNDGYSPANLCLGNLYLALSNSSVNFQTGGWIQWGINDTKISRTTATRGFSGVPAVEIWAWAGSPYNNYEAGTLITSNLQVDHIDSDSGGGIYLFDKIQATTTYPLKTQNNVLDDGSGNMTVATQFNLGSSYWGGAGSYMVLGANAGNWPTLALYPAGYTNWDIFSYSDNLLHFSVGGTSDKMTLDPSGNLTLVNSAVVTSGNSVIYFFQNGSSGIEFNPSGIAAANVLPISGGSGLYCGSSTSPWNYVYGEYIYEHNSGGSGHSCYGFDYLDDLSYAKNYKTIMEDGVQKIDMTDGFPFLLDEKGWTTSGKRFGFTMGCIKQLALKSDEQDSKIDSLLAEIEELKSKVAA